MNVWLRVLQHDSPSEQLADKPSTARWVTMKPCKTPQDSASTARPAHRRRRGPAGLPGLGRHLGRASATISDALAAFEATGSARPCAGAQGAVGAISHASTAGLESAADDYR